MVISMSDILIQRIATLTSLQVLEDAISDYWRKIPSEWLVLLENDFSLKTIVQCQIGEGIRRFFRYEQFDSSEFRFVVAILTNFYRNILIATELFLYKGKLQKIEDKFENVSLFSVMVA